MAHIKARFPIVSTLPPYIHYRLKSGTWGRLVFGIPPRGADVCVCVYSRHTRPYLHGFFLFCFYTNETENVYGGLTTTRVIVFFFWFLFVDEPSLRIEKPTDGNRTRCFYTFRVRKFVARFSPGQYVVLGRPARYFHVLHYPYCRFCIFNEIGTPAVRKAWQRSLRTVGRRRLSCSLKTTSEKPIVVLPGEYETALSPAVSLVRKHSKLTRCRISRL